MTYRAHIEHGAIVLDSPIRLPEGTTLSIRPLKGKVAAKKTSKKTAPSFMDALAPLIGKNKGLPSNAKKISPALLAARKAEMRALSEGLSEEARQEAGRIGDEIVATRQIDPELWA